MKWPGVRKAFKKLLKWSAWGLLGWVVLSVFLVLLFRFVPVPTTAFMVEREVASWFSDQPYASRHHWVPLKEIAPCARLAVIAAEDQNFPDHHGFDWEAIETAVEHNRRSRRTHGASTLTQQTAKNLFLWPGRSWVRKGFEVYFTVLLEGLWPKHRILEVYLNSAEFGDGIYGVEAASWAHFNKGASALGPREAALLAAVLPSPRKYRADRPGPYVRQRQAWILQQMEQLGGDATVKALGE